MKKLLLIATPFWDPECPAFSLVQLASYLKARSAPVETTILDFNLLAPELHELRSSAPAGMHPPMFHFGDAYAELMDGNGHPVSAAAESVKEVVDLLAETVLRYDFDIAGFTVNLATWFFTLPLMERIRKERPQALVIAGGPHASFLCEVAARVSISRFCQLMERSASLIVVREGEETLYEIVLRHQAGEELENRLPAGTAVFTAGVMRLGPPRPMLADLDVLPSPDYCDFGLEDVSAFESVHLELSRGCVFKCSFCSDPGYWQNHRRRSAAKVRKDLAAVRPKTRWGVLRLSDSGFYPWLPGQEEILDAFASIEPAATWSSYTTIRRMTGDHARQMFRAGCRLVSFGVESADDSQLKRMGKAFRGYDPVATIAEAREAGLITEASLVFCFPGETEASLARTLNLVDTLSADTRLKIFEFMPAVFSRFVATRVDDWSTLFSGSPRPDAVCVGPGVYYHPPLFCDPRLRDVARQELAARGLHADFYPRDTGLRRVASGDVAS